MRKEQTIWTGIVAIQDFDPTKESLVLQHLLCNHDVSAIWLSIHFRHKSESITSFAILSTENVKNFLLYVFSSAMAKIRLVFTRCTNAESRRKSLDCLVRELAWLDCFFPSKPDLSFSYDARSLDVFLKLSWIFQSVQRWNCVRTITCS